MRVIRFCRLLQIMNKLVQNFNLFHETLIGINVQHTKLMLPRRKRVSGFRLFVWSVAFAFASTGATFADTVKVGVIGSFSGPYAIYGKAWQGGISAYMKKNGDSAAGHKIEVIYRDLPTTNPQQARALAQELVVKDKVQYLAGFVFTPDALAVASLVNEAKIPSVIFNAATSMILDKSDYFLRASFTTQQVAVPVARYATQQGVKSVVTMVTDYAPGIDEEVAFSKTFEDGGGKVLSAIRMPLSTTDFGPYLQRAKSAQPQAIFGFLPGGPSTYAYIKTYLETGVKAAGIRYFGTGETQEFDLQAMGDSAIGLETGFIYSGAHQSAANDDFKKFLAEVDKDAIPSLLTMEGYDGIHMIYKMVEATDAKQDGEKAIKAVAGMEWESPRGPVRIDAKSRDLVQNVYMRIVEREASGKLINKETYTFPMQPDYGRGSPPAK
jgi:branched-chain amino acid transport system substrate-binding protein